MNPTEPTELERKRTSATIQEAEHRAERAEHELERMRNEIEHLKQSQAHTRETGESKRVVDSSEPNRQSIEALRKDSMMAHLLDSLDAGKDIGHYGRLVFAMIAHHFIDDSAVVEWLVKDPDFSAEAAQAMVRQVKGRDYSPPRRERILEWQAEQEFPILPDPNNPDCGNVYRNLRFPQQVYEHIQEYQEEKAGAENV